MSKQKLLLLDADIIFFAHEYGIWDVLVERYEVYVVATVLEQEAKYFKTPSGTRGSNLRELEAAGKIHRLEASAKQIQDCFASFDPSFTKQLDAGEMEGITVVASGEPEHIYFCTGDTNGIQALGMLGLSVSVVSMESLINEASAKLAGGKVLAQHLKQRSVEHHLKIGQERRITGEYFKGWKSPLL